MGSPETFSRKGFWSPKAIVGGEFRDIKRITGKILDLWLERRQEDMAFAILKEIAEFSREGKNILKGLIIEAMKGKPAEKAFDSLFLYKRFYAIDPPLMEALAGNKEYSTLLVYLPVYRDNEWVARCIDKGLDESQWVTFFNSATDKINDNLEKLLTGQLNPKESNGYIISNWVILFLFYQDRREFLEIHQSQPRAMIGIEHIRCDFGGYARVDYPLRLFHPLAENMEPVHISKISGQRFIFEDRKTYMPLNDKIFASWFYKILSNIFLIFEKGIPPAAQPLASNQEQLTTKISDFSRNFSRHFSRYYYRNIRRVVSRNLSRSLSRDLSRNFNRDFTRDFSMYFHRDFHRDFSMDLSLDLSKDFRINRNFNNFISPLYEKKYHEKLDLQNSSGRSDWMIYELMKEELEKGEKNFMDWLFNNLFRYLLGYKFEITFDFFGTVLQSFSGKGLAGVTCPRNSLSIANPFIIPFTFYFLLTAALSHYSLNILSDLNGQLHGKEEINLEEIEKVVDDLCKRNPVDFYFLAFSWNFYAQAFNEQYRKQAASETRELSLAAFVVSAARVSLTAGVPCEGDEWDKTLAEAQQSENPFVQISLTHYQLINSTEPAEREKNEALLKQQLAKFKNDYPDYYRLIGFQEK